MLIFLKAPKSFPDVRETDTFYHYIRYLSSIKVNGERVINGYEDGEFKADQPITREQMAKIMALVLEYNDSSVDCSNSDGDRFLDVQNDNKFKRYIYCLYDEEVFWGDERPDNLGQWYFDPSENISRGQFAAIVNRGLISRTAEEETQPGVANQQRSTSACVPASFSTPMRLFTTGFDQETDCLTLNSVLAGETFSFVVNNQGWNADIQLEIRKQGGSSQLSVGKRAKEGPINAVWTPSESGNYEIRLTNTDRYAKEGSDYLLQVDRIDGQREYRVDPEREGLCGQDGHIQLEVTPQNANEVEIEVRKCDFERFSESGEYWILVDGQEKWGPYSYSSGSRVFRRSVRPGDIGIFGRHEYQIRIHPSRQSNRAMWTGKVRVWDFYKGRNVDFRDIDYIYHIGSPSSDCDGIIRLRNEN